jgi:hypothetical protein
LAPKVVVMATSAASARHQKRNVRGALLRIKRVPLATKVGLNHAAKSPAG